LNTLITHHLYCWGAELAEHENDAPRKKQLQYFETEKPNRI